MKPRQHAHQKEAQDAKEQRTPIGQWAGLFGGPEAVKKADKQFPASRIIELTEAASTYEHAKTDVYQLLTEAITLPHGRERIEAGLALVRSARDRLDIRGKRKESFECRCRLTGIIAELEGYLA